MTLTHVQPRRRAARGSEDATTQNLPSLDTTKDISVRKGSTFHQPKSPSSPATDPIISIKGLPPRSLTSPTALEELLSESDKRVNDIISTFDRSLSGLGANTKTELEHQDRLPVPASLAAHVSTKSKLMEEESKHNLRGQGTLLSPRARQTHANPTKASTSVYKPLAKPSLSTRPDHVLSEYAAKVIKLHIIDPIVDEESLKDFHPLVKGLPQRIGSHQIRCLRDLEKVLIFLAPVSTDLSSGEGVLAHCFLRAKHTAKSARSYLDFCEVSIQCIHTTVDHLNELDLRRPTDRPYTNNYFVDLVEQVRQYARIMAASRQKKAKGEPLDDSDIQPLVPQVVDDSSGNALLTLISGEKILLRGGVGEEGKPLELVRERDGKFIPIDAGHVDIDEDMLDDDVHRSMARKRKCDIGKVEYRACRECGKVYTRPCDLTKHEKTHSRPWKCTEPGCKYFEFGWPTEKERDRHMNDKHSSAPALYHCLWKNEGCTYTSKRESNCKQHMEKAHGWDYIRSKSKKGTKLVPTAASPTTSLMPTPLSERMSTPALTASSNQSPAPSTFDGYSPADSSSHSAMGSTRGSLSSYHATPYAPSPSDSEPVFSFNEYSKEFSYGGYLSPNASEGYNDRQESVMPSTVDMTPPSTNSGLPAATFEQDFNFGNLNYNWSTLGDCFPQYNIPQQPTPIGSDYELDFDINPSKSNAQSISSGLSPNVSGNAMLFGQDDTIMQESQGYADFAAQAKPGQQQQLNDGDFTLFGEVQDGQSSSQAVAAMFPDLGDVGGHFDQEMNAGMFDQMSEEEMDRYLYGDGN